MHAFFTDESAESFLIDEIRRAQSQGSPEVVAPRWVLADTTLDAPWVFARQTLPNAEVVEAPSINAWADRLIQAVLGTVPDSQPWRLHIVPVYGEGNAGQHRCQLILAAFRERLQKRRRSLLRALVVKEGPFAPDESFAQLYLFSPDRGVISVAVAPLPVEARRNVWPFARGELPIAVDKTAPSRAFAKLVESEQRLGERITAGQSVVDLGACPGSWSYVAIHRGARVTSVDRSPVRDDLLHHRRLTFVQGDAFKFLPEQPVDWLICDVIAAPERSIDLLLNWVRDRHARRFVVSIKFKGSSEYPLLDRLKTELAAECREYYLTRLCANKNEACAFGLVD